MNPEQQEGKVVLAGDEDRKKGKEIITESENATRTEDMKKFHGPLDHNSLFSVFSRVPVKNLHLLKCANYDWKKIISFNLFFIKLHLKNTKPTLSGFFFQNKTMQNNEDIEEINFMNITSLDRHYDNQGPISNATIHHKVLSFLPKDVVVLSSCNGLVCCRSCSLFSSSTKTTLYICNPINKQWLSLSCLDYSKHESIVLAFDNFDQYNDPIVNSTKFHLVRLKQIEKKDEGEEDEIELSHYFTFELYSSTTNLWKISDEKCYYDGSIQKQGIYIGNVLHWLTSAYQILTFDLNRELSLVISTPNPDFKYVHEACIGEWKGILFYLVMTEYGLHVWHLKDYYEAKWVPKFWKSWEDIENENPNNIFRNLMKNVYRNVPGFKIPWMEPFSFQGGVLLMRVHVRVYFYDIGRHLMVEACNIQNLQLRDLRTNFLPNPIVLPYSPSLAPL